MSEAQTSIMRIVVHDYVGHPFQVHLSRRLAHLGHTVHHVYFADNPGPKGSFERRLDDPSWLYFVAITLGSSVQQAAISGSGLARRTADVAYGRKAAAVVQQIKPEVVLSGNTPTEAQRAILQACIALRIRFVYWVQDIYSLAVTTYLRKRLGFLGTAIGRYYQRLDRQQFRASDAIVVISADFAPIIQRWGGRSVSVIENWAALDDLPVGNKVNHWSCARGLDRGFTYLYTGTLGRKHNPQVLVALAKHCQRGDSVTVVGQGVGFAHLQATQSTESLPALRLLPLQPAKDMADVLATADVLIATIEAEAGIFAVPSKVLSYLCAGRPILLAAAKDNLAARTILKANAGIVVDPADAAEFIAVAERLRKDRELCAELGRNGRAYAEKTFDMTRIAAEFETILQQTGDASYWH
jgi:colanic acid biosynthesis glycosyl transferase WcaI